MNAEASKTQPKQLFKVAATSFFFTVLFFLACALVVTAVIGCGAKSALLSARDDASDPVLRPQIPVYEMSIDTKRTYSTGYAFDTLVAASFRARCSDFVGDAWDIGVQHFADWEYDGYYLPVSRSYEGFVRLLFVDTTFARTAALASCAAASVLFCGILIATRLSRGRYIRLRNQAEAVLEKSFANASHELKTPLMAIRGYAEGVREGTVAPDFATERIVAAADRMALTVDGILKISRADAGLRQPELAMWDVREVIYDQARLIEDDCAARGIGLDMQLPRPLNYACDQSMLSTVFINVLGNAARHAESFVRVSEGANGAGDLEILVDNDGEPPSGEALEHAFDRFYRGATGNTGIGLALSREYTELMGGEIAMLPMPWGSRVRIRL